MERVGGERSFGVSGELKCSNEIVLYNEERKPFNSAELEIVRTAECLFAWENTFEARVVFCRLISFSSESCCGEE